MLTSGELLEPPANNSEAPITDPTRNPDPIPTVDVHSPMESSDPEQETCRMLEAATTTAPGLAEQESESESPGAGATAGQSNCYQWLLHVHGSTVHARKNEHKMCIEVKSR